MSINTRKSGEKLSANYLSSYHPSIHYCCECTYKLKWTIIVPILIYVMIHLYAPGNINIICPFYVCVCVRVVKEKTNICTLEKFDIFSDGKRKQGQLLIRQIKCSVKCVSYFSWGLLCITHFTEFPWKAFPQDEIKGLFYLISCGILR